MASKVEIWQNNRKIRTLDTLTDGNVRMDDTEFRTTMDFVCQDEDGDLVPTNRANNILEPGFSYAKAFRGLYLSGDTTPTYIPMGASMINEVRVDDSGESVTLSVDCVDWAVRMHEDKLEKTFVIPKGQWVWFALYKLLAYRLEPWQSFRYRGDDQITTSERVYPKGESRWTHAQTLARTIGCEVFFDENLDLIIQPFPKVGRVVDEYVEGPNCSLLYGSKIRDLEGVYNRVEVSGENPKNGTIHVAVAENHNPFSPTSIERIGRRTYTTTSGALNSANHARLYARTLLEQKSGRPERMELTTLVNPGLRLGDTVRVTREALGTNSLQVLDKLTFPLVPGRGTAVSCRERFIEP
jgi:hypothetical protein